MPSHMARTPALGYSTEQRAWVEAHASARNVHTNLIPDHLVVASFNVLPELETPSTGDRHNLVVQTLLGVNATADILILQGVTDDLLSVLLADATLQVRYPYVSRPPPAQGQPPAHPRIVVLSKHYFSWEQLPSKTPSSPTCLAVFEYVGLGGLVGDNGSFVVAAVHLTRGLTDEIVAAKCTEMEALITHLSEHYSTSKWIITGSFNMASSSRTISVAQKENLISNRTMSLMHYFETELSRSGFHDAWTVSRIESGESSDDIKQREDSGPVFEGEQGATFYPQHHHLAAGDESTNRPQRYDRILFRQADGLHPTGFNMFSDGRPAAGDPGSLSDGLWSASEQYGIRCLLRARKTLAHEVEISETQMDRIRAHTTQGSLTRPPPLREFLTHESIIPTTEDEKYRARAFATLVDTILDCGPEVSSQSSSGMPRILAIAVGSYGLGVWTSQSDIDCLCLGSISPTTFFKIAKQRLRKASPLGIRILRTVSAASGKMLELETQGVKVDLHYCQAPAIALRWPDVLKRPSTDDAFSLSFDVLAKLKPARDLAYLRRSIPDLALYRLAHRAIKAWSSARGIYGARFGYLGGVHISALLVPICKTLAYDAASAEGYPPSAEDVVTTFFDYYAAFPWDTAIVFDPFYHKSIEYRRTSREPLCILGWHPPSLNTAATASKSTTRILTTELERARVISSSPDWTWLRLIGSGQSVVDELPQGVMDFLSAYEVFVRLEIHYWGSSPQGGAKLLSWVESRCASILVGMFSPNALGVCAQMLPPLAYCILTSSDIGIRVEGAVSRIWPQRFTKSHPAPEADPIETYEGFYLIGVASDKASGCFQIRDDDNPTMSNLRAVVQQSERRITSDGNHFDPRTSWFGASIVQGTQLGRLMLDGRQWGRYVEEDESDEDDGETEEDTFSAEWQMPDMKANLCVRSSEQTVPAAHQHVGEETPKLRTAIDVLNRLRWDPDLDSDDYSIGYLDRFDGIQEKAVAAWKSEQTDEEFIPQHRIAYFRKKSTGLVVWDRARRIDLVFGHSAS